MRRSREETAPQALPGDLWHALSELQHTHPAPVGHLGPLARPVAPLSFAAATDTVLAARVQLSGAETMHELNETLRSVTGGTHAAALCAATRAQSAGPSPPCAAAPSGWAETTASTEAVVSSATSTAPAGWCRSGLDRLPGADPPSRTMRSKPARRQADGSWIPGGTIPGTGGWRTRYERRADLHEGLLELVRGVICLRRVFETVSYCLGEWARIYGSIACRSPAG